MNTQAYIYMNIIKAFKKFSLHSTSMNILKSATLNYLSVFYCMLRQWVTALQQLCASSPPCHQVWQVVPEALHFNFNRGLWQELII